MTVTAVQQSQANGRAAQRFHILVEGVIRTAAEIIVDHPVAQWAVRHTEWINNLLAWIHTDPSSVGTFFKHTFMTHALVTKA